jgi:predicted MPP superfamily phosphohydrolase
MKDSSSNADLVTILHLSDLHFGWDVDERGRADRDLALKGLLRLISEIEPQWKPTVVCITGDIGWRGQAGDYTEAEKWIRQLLDLLDLPPEALFMCPGNHDSNRSIAKLNKRPSVSAEADEWLIVPLPESVERPFQAYIDFAERMGVPPYMLGDKESFLAGQRAYRGINFVSYNSAWYTQGDDRGRLWVGLNLIKWLESKGQLPHPSKLAEHPATVALIHHPREWLHDEELHVHSNRPSTFDSLVRRCHLLLTGHVHSAPRPADQFAGAAWHLSGGAAYAGASHFNSFRLIRAEADGFAYQTFEYDPRSSDNIWRRVGDTQTIPIRVKAGEHGPGTVSDSEVLAYLDALAERMAELPAYYPSHLRADEVGKTRFDNIRQMVQVVEDRTSFQRWLAEERERMRASGEDFDRVAYKPMRALPEAGERGQGCRDYPVPPILWDERAGQRFKRAVILGDPGFGKSWLLRYEARRLANDAAQRLRKRSTDLAELTLPIFARLSDLSQSDAPLEDAFVELVSAEAGAGGSDAFRGFVREKLRSDRCVILLDAWDEVPVEPPEEGQPIRYEPGYRQRLGKRLASFARQYPLPRLLLTSRIVGYNATHLSVPKLQELELLAFNSPQTESFVSVWFGDDTQAANQCLAMLRQNPQMRGLARIPLMLTLLCRTYLECKEKHCDFPTRRVELYDCCLRGLLRDWREEKEAREISDAYVDAVLELLHAVGYTLFVEGYEQFGESDLRRQIITWRAGLKYKHELDERDATSIIAELKRDGVLITAGEHRGAPLLFLHRTFHEYLTACALAATVNDQKKGWGAEIESQGERVSVHQLVDRKAGDSRWQEVIVLLAGRLQNPAPLLEMLADEKRDDASRSRLALAALCLPEMSPTLRTRHSQLVNQITTAAFTYWWEQQAVYARGQSEPVPALSRALPALAKVNGLMDGTPLLDWVHRYFSSDVLEEVALAGLAITFIGSVALTGPILDRLCELLGDWTDWDEICLAARIVSNLGEEAAIPEIFEALSDGTVDISEPELFTVMALLGEDYLKLYQESWRRPAAT